MQPLRRSVRSARKSTSTRSRPRPGEKRVRDAASLITETGGHSGGSGVLPQPATEAARITRAAAGALAGTGLRRIQETATLECVPSQKGGVAVRLQPQRNPVSVFSAVK